jgi:hypothetical protein
MRRYQHKGDVRGTHLTRKNDKMPLVDRFTALANITSTNLDDHDIVFPELKEIFVFKKKKT